eukprot:3673816-Rhodomonas_salina.2
MELTVLNAAWAARGRSKCHRDCQPERWLSHGCPRHSSTRATAAAFPSPRSQAPSEPATARRGGGRGVCGQPGPRGAGSRGCRRT